MNWTVIDNLPSSAQTISIRGDLKTMLSELLDLNREVFANHCAGLLKFLDREPDLSSALASLEQYHKLLGFVKDDLSGVETFSIASHHPELTFTAQYNPRRKRRFEIKESLTRPDGVILAYDDCPLVRENIWWMQRGSQIPYSRRINNRVYDFLVQPFPFGEGHCTVPSLLDEPQDWRPDLSTLHQRVLDICSVLLMLGNYAGLYNGVCAGASIHVRFHFQVLRQRGGFPIQEAARRAALQPATPSVLRFPEDAWPLTAFRINGPPGFVACEVARLAARWQEIAGEQATESIAMFVEDGGVICIYVPRDRKQERTAGFGGAVGSYEAALGVLIFSEEKEGAALRGGNVTATDIWEILAGVRPERAVSL